MSETAAGDLESAVSTTVIDSARRRRLFGLAVVLCVSLLHFIASSTYVLLGGMAPSGPDFISYRLMGAIVSESTALTLLWYVISERQGGWKSIGWTPESKDLWRGLGVLIASLLATIPPVIIFQFAYHGYAGHFLAAKDLRQVLGFSVSAISIAFVLINPCFEELIVRAYTMTEIMDLGGSRFLAILVSVLLQLSYHLYQGLVRSIAVAATFTVFSIYFARTRRIMPVVIAHFCIDAFALIRSSH